MAPLPNVFTHGLPPFLPHRQCIYHAMQFLNFGTTDLWVNVGYGQEWEESLVMRDI